MDSLSREQLIQVILDQHRMIEQLRAEVEQLKRRGGAAPFSKGTNKPNPKPPGRKPGQGFFRFRKAPEKALGNGIDHRYSCAAAAGSPALRSRGVGLQGMRAENTLPAP